MSSELYDKKRQKKLRVQQIRNLSLLGCPTCHRSNVRFSDSQA